jgi:glucose dehydrogenase
MSVLLDGTWTEIYSSGRVPGGISVTVLLSTLDMPMLFQPGVITGLKLSTKGDVNYAYQKMNGTQFAFDFISTPLPAALPLFGGGLAVIGLLRWRRRRLQEAAPERQA